MTENETAIRRVADGRFISLRRSRHARVPTFASRFRGSRGLQCPPSRDTRKAVFNPRITFNRKNPSR